MSHLDRGDEFRADLAELRHAMQLGFANVDARFATIDQKFDGVRLEIREQVAGATARLLKWSFVFWVSAVGAIAGLAGVLR